MLACCYFYTGFTAPGSLSEYKLQKNFRFVIRSSYVVEFTRYNVFAHLCELFYYTSDFQACQELFSFLIKTFRLMSSLF